MNEPEFIIHNGVTYYLDSRIKQLENGITEGPFYVNSPIKFTPDAEFLAGKSAEPAMMNPIQVHIIH